MQISGATLLVHEGKDQPVPITGQALEDVSLASADLLSLKWLNMMQLYVGNKSAKEELDLLHIISLTNHTWKGTWYVGFPVYALGFTTQALLYFHLYNFYQTSQNMDIF